MMGDVIPLRKAVEPTPEQIVRGARIEILLSTAYALTHRIERAQHGPVVKSLRAQRDLITNEIIRRTMP